MGAYAFVFMLGYGEALLYMSRAQRCSQIGVSQSILRGASWEILVVNAIASILKTDYPWKEDTYIVIRSAYMYAE